MANFVEENAVSRKNTHSLKWDALNERFGNPDLLPLWVADMEFQTPKPVIEALKKRVEHGVFGYSKVPDDYFEKFNHWQETQHQITLQPEWLRFSKGVVESLYHLLQIFTQEADSVLIQPPVYYPFFNAIKDTKRKLVINQLQKTATGYEIDLNDFEHQIRTENVKLFLLCSPHNPVGRVWSEETLEQLLAICKKYQVLVIADEIHQDFVYAPNKFTSALNVAKGAYQEQLIVVNAPSKTFNLASLLNAHVLIPNAILRETYDQRIKVYSQSEHSDLGQLAAKTAYEQGAEWFAGLKEVILENYQYVKTTFAKELPTIEVAELQGTYLLWLNFESLALGADLERFIKEECQLAVDFGEWFSKETTQFIRLNLATTPKNIQKAVQQIIQAVKQREEEIR